MIKVIPNLLSILRVFLVPIFVIAYFTDPNEIKINAIIIYAIAAISDFLDGFIARKFQVVSNLGMILDPLGDKLMIVTVLVCLTIDGIIPFWVVCIAFLKELLMAIGGYVLSRATKIQALPSNIWGKVSTIVFFLVCLILMIFRGIPYLAATGLITAAVILMLIAFASYIHRYHKYMKNKHNINSGVDT